MRQAFNAIFLRTSSSPLQLHRHIAHSSVVSCWAELPSCGNTLLQQIMHEHGQASL